MIFPYLETAVSFALVMLVASLMVNVAVRILYTVRGERSDGVVDMLRALHRGFCKERGLDLGKARGAAEDAFVDDVMGSPTLHAAARWDEIQANYDKDVARADALRAQAADATGSAADREQLLLAADAIVRTADAERKKTLRREIDWLRRGDLLAIIRARATDVDHLDLKAAPTAWFPAVAPPTQPPPTDVQRELFGYPQAATQAIPVVSARDFHDYCTRWFTTVEANASNRFGDEQRRVARSISGLAVVLLNLDAIHLAYDLYQDRALSDRLSARVDDVVALAKQIGADQPQKPGQPEQDLGKLEQALQKTATILTVERVPIGWQDSYMAKRWCAYHDDCDDTTVAKPTTKELVLDLMLWVFGLGTSWMLLSLGAPFWVSVLEKITGLANLLSGTTGDDHTQEEKAWVTEGAGETASYGGVTPTPPPSPTVTTTAPPESG